MALELVNNIASSFNLNWTVLGPVSGSITNETPVHMVRFLLNIIVQADIQHLSAGWGLRSLEIEGARV